MSMAEQARASPANMPCRPCFGVRRKANARVVAANCRRRPSPAARRPSHVLKQRSLPNLWVVKTILPTQSLQPSHGAPGHDTCAPHFRPGWFAAAAACALRELGWLFPYAYSALTSVPIDGGDTPGLEEPDPVHEISDTSTDSQRPSETPGPKRPIAQAPPEQETSAARSAGSSPWKGPPQESRSGGFNRRQRRKR